MEIDVKKGWKEGTKVTFSKEGHQAPGKVPADIVFIVKDKPHPVFTRDKDNNLRHTAKISLRDALTGTTLKIKGIDERVIAVPITEIVNPKTERIINGAGLPLPKSPSQRADLVISFDIQFPYSLPNSSKQALQGLLPV